MIAEQIEFPLQVAICAWCKPVRKSQPSPADLSLSHGICPRHLKQIMVRLQRAKLRRETEIRRPKSKARRKPEF